MKETLIAYYSLTGTTKTLAGKIHKHFPDSDLFEITVSDDVYPTDMYEIADVDERIKQKKTWPKISQLPDVQQYTKIIIGGPVWGDNVPSPIISFLNEIQNYQGNIDEFHTDVGQIRHYEDNFRRYLGNLKVDAFFDANSDSLDYWFEQQTAR
ncbi:flavodoxin [Lactiplantibacillus pentosus]|jgi:flavodoxin|uniref:flavodoxin n=1 Tax=Lactiplantibacillus pentosus TaxID=1589 RepID=UPI0021A850CE|nr:hypothetical protein [Lactiplantibacillus pentosus]MCT3286194.1 hypothetical protein [Lactiplantibacillus pentosus]